jgi:hypothetical protein
LKTRIYKKKYDHKRILELHRAGVTYEEIQKMHGKKLKLTNIHQIIKHEELLEQLHNKELELKNG